MVSGHVKTQLIAHDKEVYDIAFSKAGGGRDMFASVGADGSVRMFDLRHLEHSTIIYEDPTHTPLLRLAWNKQDTSYLATVAMDASEVIILDIRVPCTPVARLNNHRACVNGIAWAPHSSCHICTAGDDHQALIWDIQQMPRAIEDPILAYTAAEGEINQIQWGATQPDWIGEETRLAALDINLSVFSNLLQQESRDTKSVITVRRLRVFDICTLLHIMYCIAQI